MMCTLDLGFTGSIIFSTDGEKSTSAVFAIMVYKKRDEKKVAHLELSHQNHG